MRSRRKSSAPCNMMCDESSSLSRQNVCINSVQLHTLTLNPFVFDLSENSSRIRITHTASYRRLLHLVARKAAMLNPSFIIPFAIVTSFSTRISTPIPSEP